MLRKTTSRYLLDKVIKLLAVTTVLGLIFTIGGPASPASAAPPHYCSDSTTIGPRQPADVCFVRHSDVNRAYVAEVTGQDHCLGIGTTYHKMRIRIVGDYVASGDKFRVRQFSVRYLDGIKYWAYFRVQVLDGNNAFVKDRKSVV